LGGRGHGYQKHIYSFQGEILSKMNKISPMVAEILANNEIELISIFLGVRDHGCQEHVYSVQGVILIRINKIDPVVTGM